MERLATVGSDTARRTLAGARSADLTALAFSWGTVTVCWIEIGAAVDGGQGEGVFGMGGAITWGNWMLYQAQEATGLNISDWTMHGANWAIRLFMPSAADLSGFQAGQIAGALGAPAGVESEEVYNFDPELYKKSSEQIEARIKELKGMAGGLGKEAGAAKKQARELRDEAQKADQEAAELQKESRPITPQERAEFERLKKELDPAIAQAYIESKLAQGDDLKNPKSDNLAEVKKLKEIQDYYNRDGRLGEEAKDRAGFWDALGVKEASLKALYERVSAIDEDRALRRKEGPLLSVDQAVLKEIDALMDEIEVLRGDFAGETANRDALTRLLAAQNKLHNLALHNRRDGKAVLNFRTDASRLAAFVDLAFAVKEINEAQKVIREMQAFLGAKLQKIKTGHDGNIKNKAEAEAQLAKTGEWKKDVEKNVKESQTSKNDMLRFLNEADAGVKAISSFQTRISQIIAVINRDAGGGEAEAFYNEAVRKINNGDLVRLREKGNPNDPDAFSLAKMEKDLQEARENIADAERGLRELGKPDLEHMILVINAIPGPRNQITSPQPDAMIEALKQRKQHWQAKQDEFQKTLNYVNLKLDPGNTRETKDELGAKSYESARYWQKKAGETLIEAQGNTRALTMEIDQLAARINAAVPDAGLPPLSGGTLTQLQDNIKAYGDKIRAVQIPRSDEPRVTEAQINVIKIAELLPYAAYEVIRWSEADGALPILNDAVGNVLPETQRMLQGLIKMFDQVKADVDADIAWATDMKDDAFRKKLDNQQAVVVRKNALLQNAILPPVREAERVIRDVLIPFQNKSIESARPPGGDLLRLYDGKLTLIRETKKLYNTTVPWALASHGGPEGQPGPSVDAINYWISRLQRNIDGYDDAQGHHKGIKEGKDEVAWRKGPTLPAGESRPAGKGGPNEMLYGELQPYDLPGKINKYAPERVQRAAQYKAQADEINRILAKIEQLSNGQYNFSAHRLRTDISADAAGAAKLQELVDTEFFQRLGDRLLQVGEDAKGKGSGAKIELIGNSGGPPTGSQKPLEASTYDAIALLTKDAGVRLVPASLKQPDSAPATYAVARFLFADAVIKASNDALREQIPLAQIFLDKAQLTIERSIAMARSQDIPYVNSQGARESAESVYKRTIENLSNIRDFVGSGVDFFDMKILWDQDAAKTVDKVNTYYDSLAKIYGKGLTVGDKEVEAWQKMHDALQTTYKDLQTKRARIENWLRQLSRPEESALARVGKDISAIMDLTKAVGEANKDWHEVNDQLKRTDAILKSKRLELEAKQARLREVLADPALQDSLDPARVARIEKLRMSRGMWAAGSGGDDPEFMVVKKSQLSAFVDGVLNLWQYKNSMQNLDPIRQDLLGNPAALANLIPHSQILDFSDTADGFYLVYQSRFSLPHGLENATQVTLGNIGRVMGNNLSLTGYVFGSPSNDENAPYGDKGLSLGVESLQFKNGVNYIDVDLHRFAYDIPPDAGVVSQAKQMRLRVFEDHAEFLFGDRLYWGAAGFADFALDNAMEKPYYYGGVTKASLKLHEVARLNVEQQALWVKDPRFFQQPINLDFTGFDPDLRRDFPINVKADDRRYYRTQAGPSFDVARLFNMDSDKGFSLDMFFSKTSGTDDINQTAMGASILNSFSLKDDKGKPWAVFSNKVQGELGQKFNTLSDTLSASFPDHGLVISAEGKILGTAKEFYGNLRATKKLGEHSSIGVGYGAAWLGMNNRASLNMETSYTLRQIWEGALGRAREKLSGGEILDAYKGGLDEFLSRRQGDKSAQLGELQRVFDRDMAGKIITQDIGRIFKEIQDLRKAGSFLDNTRVSAMAGYTSSAVSDDRTERTLGGGPGAGSQTSLTLSKTQKALIAAKTPALFREGLRLQEHKVERVKQLQGLFKDLAQTQWELRVARSEIENAGSPALSRQAEVRLAEAAKNLNQAILSYNSYTGRDPAAALPAALKQLDSSDLVELNAHIREIMSVPDGLIKILRSLDKEELEARLGLDPFNFMDYIPWVERLTFSVGVQLQDIMANQFFTLGATIRLPLYDPHSQAADKAFEFEMGAAHEEMEAAYDDQLLRLAREVESARLWANSAEILRPRLPQAVHDLETAIRDYRNKLITPTQMRAAFETWRWYITSLVDADGKAALASARANLDSNFARKLPRDNEPIKLSSLDAAFGIISRKSHSLEEAAKRHDGAKAMSQANNHRIQKAFVDVVAGAGLASGGMGWIPMLAITGIPVMPIFGFEFKPEELRLLQVKGDEAQSEYYLRLKTKLEAGLAFQLYQNIAAYDAAQKNLKNYDELLSQLPPGKNRDEVKLRREQALSTGNMALTTINYLLGRSADSPLDIELSAQAALAELSRLLKKLSPKENEQALLAARVELARSYQTMVEKNLKVEQMAIDPFSMLGRSLGRLIRAMSEQDAGDADKAASATIRTLSEQKAHDNFPREVAVQAASARAQLKLAQEELKSLEPKNDPESLIKKTELIYKSHVLKAGLALIGEAEDAASRSPQPLPRDFSELKGRLKQKQREIFVRPSQGPSELPDPGFLNHQARAFGRYYYANRTLSKEKIDRHFGEGWLELRLRYDRPPADVLVKLQRLKEQKADRLYHDAMIKESARAEILAGDFEANVHMLRWARGKTASPDGQFQGKLDEFIRRKDLQIKQARNQIVAMLGLDPRTSPEDLIALVPRHPSGALDPDVIAKSFLEKVRQAPLEQIRKTVFESGLPGSLRDEDDLIHQITADMLAESFSFKGVNYVGSAGLFRGKMIAGGFAEAPDPSAIENGLEKVISRTLRSQLEKLGAQQELSLNLHSLFAKVQDGMILLEAKRKAIEALEEEYRALMGQAKSDAQITEADAARERVVKAWLDFAEQITQTKSEFVALRGELEALELSSDVPLRAAGSEFEDMPRLKHDPKEELLTYWTDRFLDDDFKSRQAAILDKLGAGVSPELKAKIAEKAHYFRMARRNADAVLHKDFAPGEKFEWLSRNDFQGKREALRAQLAELLKGLGTLEKANPAWAELLGFLRSDIEKQDARSVLERAQRVVAGKGLRQAYWKAVPAPHAVDGAFASLEILNAKVDETRQVLLDGYMLNISRDPSYFILKDMLLDDYLKAQASFDAELVKTISSQEVREDKAYSWGLDGLYDIRGALARSIDGARSGRGMLALDALIMLEESRLAAAKWDERPQGELDAVAAALYSLKQTKQRWAKGASDLTPLHAVTSISQDGSRLWTINGWLEAGEFKTKKDSGRIIEKDGRFYLKGDGEKPLEYEVLAGVDIRASEREHAAKASQDNRFILETHHKMTTHDFVLDRPGREGKEGYSVKDIFGPQGKYGEGRIYFFEAPKVGERSGRLHRALDAVTALGMSPNDYVMYIYEGGAPPPPRSIFPTWESLKAAPQSEDFHQLRISVKGIDAMIGRATEGREGSLRQGYLKLKLNGHGFARDAQGKIAELYITSDDFSAAHKGFFNAQIFLRAAERDLKKGESKAQRLRQEADKLKETADLEYKKFKHEELGVRRHEAGKLLREGLEPGSDAFKAEFEKRVVRNSDFKSAQKHFEPYARRRTEGQDKYKEARAGVINAQKALADAKQILERSKTWSLYESRDLELELDRGGALTRALAKPVYGSSILDETIGPARGAQSLAVISGELFGVVMSGDKIKEFYQDRKAVDRAFKGWKVKSITLGKDDEPVKSADGRITKPVYRLSHYEDKDEDRVLLNRQYMIDEAREADSRQWRTKHEGIMPWNWVNLPLEVLRAPVDALKELTTGRDPNQEHYLGRLYMYKTEGGATVHHGFLRRAAGAIDILNLFPDPVERYFDPSQFPEKVKIDSAVRPGQNVLAKSMTDLEEKKDVHIGLEAWRRRLAYSREDLTSARSRTLAHFSGGVDETIISALRGREGIYERSSVKDKSGAQIIKEVLADPMVRDLRQADGSGVVKILAVPDNLAVDRVEKRLRVRLGAEQYERQAAALAGQPDRLIDEWELALSQDVKLKELFEASDLAFKESSVERQALLSRVKALWDDVHRRAWRIGAQEALERKIIERRDKAAQWRQRAAWWEDYAGRLLSGRRSALEPNPVPGSDHPQNSPPALPYMPWMWFGLLAILGSLGAWLALRRWRVRDA